MNETNLWCSVCLQGEFIWEESLLTALELCISTTIMAPLQWRHIHPFTRQSWLLCKALPPPLGAIIALELIPCRSSGDKLILAYGPVKFIHSFNCITALFLLYNCFILAFFLEPPTLQSLENLLCILSHSRPIVSQSTFADMSQVHCWVQLSGSARWRLLTTHRLCRTPNSFVSILSFQKFDAAQHFRISSLSLSFCSPPTTSPMTFSIVSHHSPRQANYSTF